MSYEMTPSQSAEELEESSVLQPSLETQPARPEHRSKKFDAKTLEEVESRVDYTAEYFHMDEGQKAYLLDAVTQTRAGNKKTFADADKLADEVTRLTNGGVGDHQKFVMKFGGKWKEGEELTVFNEFYSGLVIVVRTQEMEGQNGQGLGYVMEDIFVTGKSVRPDNFWARVKRSWEYL